MRAIQASTFGPPAVEVEVHPHASSQAGPSSLEEEKKKDKEEKKDKEDVRRGESSLPSLGSGAQRERDTRNKGTVTFGGRHFHGRDSGTSEMTSEHGVHHGRLWRHLKAA